MDAYSATNLRTADLIDNTHGYDMVDLADSLAEAEARFHKVLIVVGIAGAGKTRLLRDYAASRACPFLNLGIRLSERLLPMTSRERMLRAADVATDILDENDAPCVVVDNTEIVFDSALMMNPLGLIQSLARKRTLIWSWSGTIKDGYLTYAFPGHPEYQRIPASDLTVVAL